jgi:hypothetical protein
MHPYHLECYVMQTIYGVVPEELWKEHAKSGTDPFESMSIEAAQKMKRKFRKLKRRAGVSPKCSTSKVWNRGNRFLKEITDS